MPKLYQTPPSTPEELVCRLMKIPSSKEWLGIFNAAMITMLNEYNWEQVNDTDLEVSEAIEIVRNIILDYWDTGGCPDPDNCLIDGVYRTVRLNQFGHIEELADGLWQPPTGDYAPPPTPEREELTPEDRMCAAAANAEYVLRQVYEVATDAIQAELAADEIMLLVFEALVFYLGVWIGFVAPALMIFLIAATYAFIEIAQYMTLDLWEEDFSEALICVLLNCASDDGNVVTFDFQCVHDGMAANVDVLTPDGLNQIRLFGQVAFILSIIGAEGLNLAGATTAVVAPDCNHCLDTWCYFFDFTIDNQGWTLDYGERDGDGLYDATSSYDALTLSIAFDETMVDEIYLNFNAEWTGTSPRLVMAEDGTLTPPWLAELTGNQAATIGIPVHYLMDGLALNLDRAVGSTQYFGSLRLVSIEMRGTGENPFGEDNCPEE